MIQNSIKNRPLFMGSLAVIYVIYVVLIWDTLSAGGILKAFFMLFLPFVIFELFIRLLLFFVYGKHYRYGLLNYFLEDHSVYGYAFRKSLDSTVIDFPIFDKFVFKKGVTPNIDPLLNKEERVQYSINSLGFRGKEFTPQKKKGTIRIFCSGGSTTAGNAVADEETWPAALERKLRAANHPVEVINAGVQGWDSYQELLRLRNEIVTYEPDIILLHQGWNEEFNYSCRNLGAWWQPKVVRNLVEDRYLYSGNHPIVSNTASLLFFFAMQIYFKDFVFNRNMKFTNPMRWECLRSERYITAWFDTMIAFAKEVKERGILLYTLQYPALCDMQNSFEVRNTYIENTRLTPLFADYQAVSKKRIEKVLRSLEPIIPCIDAEKDFDTARGKDRVALFVDDVHMSASGGELFAKNVGEHLIKDEACIKLLREGSVTESNVQFDKHAIEKIRKDIGVNDQPIERFLNIIIEKLKGIKSKNDDTEVPTDRYATF